MIRDVECVDCKAYRESVGKPYPKNPRPATYQGPRCKSHDTARKRNAKTGAHERRVQRVYGLKPGQYGDIYIAQGGKCAICRWSKGLSKNLSVDHDHKTGKVRGLLCGPCNKFLGWVRDDPEAGRRIFEYLNHSPAAHLGIVAIHQDNREEEK